VVVIKTIVKKSLGTKVDVA